MPKGVLKICRTIYNIYSPDNWNGLNVYISFAFVPLIMLHVNIPGVASLSIKPFPCSSWSFSVFPVEGHYYSLTLRKATRWRSRSTFWPLNWICKLTIKASFFLLLILYSNIYIFPYKMLYWNTYKFYNFVTLIKYELPLEVLFYFYSPISAQIYSKWR